jgi:hypothetical protein
MVLVFSMNLKGFSFSANASTSVPDSPTIVAPASKLLRDKWFMISLLLKISSKRLIMYKPFVIIQLIEDFRCYLSECEIREKRFICVVGMLYELH